MTQSFKVPLEWNLPLSGAVTMPIAMPGSYGGQFGLFNINLGGSEDPALERKLIDTAGSYGKQLGRICDVIAVMLDHLENGTKLSESDPKVRAFRRLAKLIDATKGEHR